MFRACRSLKRLRNILRTLARYDALFPLERAGLNHKLVKTLQRMAMIKQRPSPDCLGKSPGQRLALAFTALGPVFIKLGQALSVRRDLVGDEMARELSSLQDRLPPFPAAHAKAMIESEFQKPLENIFSSFSDKPVAAASIAQVHLAITTDGNPVAVKVLRPGIEQAFFQELDLIGWIGELIERVFPKYRRLRLPDTINVIGRTIHQEMDLRMEAAAGDELRNNFIGDKDFYVPSIDWERTSRRVLTLERIEGLQINNIQGLLKAGHDREVILANLARIFFLQVFRDGFFHADLHPGNMFISNDGKIQVVDFGIMGRIDSRTRYYLAEMLLGFLNHDYDRVADVHFQAGYVPPDQSHQAFAQAARAIAKPIFGRSLQDISLAHLLSQLFDVTERFNMQTQPQLILLQKTMLVAEGVGRDLNPETNMWELARPLIDDWVAENMTAEAQAAEFAVEASKILKRLPFILSKIEENIELLDCTRHSQGSKDPQSVGGRAIQPSFFYWGAAAGLAILALLTI
ncbi:MAG: 2-polyprenylphenol 6-hydroxylase [Rhodospirillaceae bacterium]